MKEQSKNIIEYYSISFLSGVFTLTIFCFLAKIDSFQKGILIVVFGSAILSLVLGSVLFFSNIYVRPKTQEYFLHHKNIKSLESIGLKYNNIMNGYFGTYQDYDVQVLCHHEKMDLLTTKYVINIVFDKIDLDTVKKIQKKELFDNTKIAEFFIQKAYYFKLIPPSKEQLVRSINELVVILKDKDLKPIRLEKLETEFNNNVA